MTKQSAGLLLLGAAVLAGGCSSDGQERIADYEKTISRKPLDVPPGLSAPDSIGQLAVPEIQGGPKAPVLPQPEEVRMGRSGNMRWLVVDAPAVQVWPEVREFFRDQGLELNREEPKVGILETAWLENRADVPAGFIQGAISQVLPGLYSAPTRDKFRIRLERGTEPGTTEVYLTHYGVEQVTGGEDQLLWQRRPADTELVNEMLNRLLVYIGMPREQATTLVEQAKGEGQNRARLQGDSLIVEDPFARAWRRVGVALDRIGLLVEDRDRSAGVYFVRYTDQLVEATGEEEGWFSGWFSDDKEPAPREFRVLLSRGGDVTRVRVEPRDAAASPAMIQDFLGRLRDELR